MSKSYHLKHRVESVDKKMTVTYKDWWLAVIVFFSKMNISITGYELSFEVNKDLSTIDGFKIIDDEQECKLIISVDKNRLIFNTDADEFILPKSYTPDGSSFVCAFFMCNYDDKIYFNKINMKNVNVSCESSMKHLFFQCQKVVSIDFDSVDTDDVDDMSYAFCGCENLERIENMNFDTSKVDDMSFMFADCKHLKNVDLYSFDTSNVKNMSAMFAGCESLENIDNMDFDTSKVKNMNRMFYRCSKLKKIDVLGFDTSNVEDMSYMFAECKNLEEVDCDIFDISDCCVRKGAFDNCYAKGAYINGENLSIRDVIMYGEAPKDDFGIGAEQHFCKYNEEVEKSFEYHFYVESQDIETFRGIKINDSIDDIFNKYGKQPILNISKDDLYGMSEDLRNAIKNTHRMIELNIKVNAGYENNKEDYLFTLCYFINNDDKVKVIGYFFELVKNHNESIIFEISNNNANRYKSETSKMALQNKKKSYHLKNRVKSVVDTETVDYEDWWEEVIDFLIKNNREVDEYEVSFEVKKDLRTIDGFVAGDDIESNKLIISVDNDRLIFNTDADEFVLPDNNYQDENDNNSNSNSAFFMSDIFDKIHFKKINMKNVNTSSLTSMSNFFVGCKKLVSIDFDGVDTSNVKYMDSMFYGCKRLREIDVSSFDTSNVEDMTAMFEGCESLERIVNMKFDTSKVKVMDSMFYGCERLREIDVSCFDISNVEDTTDMFYGCYAKGAYINGEKLTIKDTFIYEKVANEDSNQDVDYQFYRYYLEVGSVPYNEYFISEDNIETYRGIKINDSISDILSKYGKQNILDIDEDDLGNISKEFRNAIEDTDRIIKLSIFTNDNGTEDGNENHILTIRFFIGDDDKVKVIGYFIDKIGKTDNIKKEIVYAWYHHGYNDAIDEISAALSEKNFEAFTRKAKKWNNMIQEDGRKWCFCPAYANLYEDDECIGRIDVFTEKGFNSITSYYMNDDND